MTTHPQFRPSSIGFDAVIRLMTSYANPDLNAASCLPVTSEPFLRMFVNASGCPASLNPYRAAVTHLRDYLKDNGDAVFAADATTLEEFRTHDCHRPGRPGIKARNGGRYIGILSRLVLLLQYQLMTPSHGWSVNDAVLCTDFRQALIANEVMPGYASNLALHAAHFVIWMRLTGVERAQADDKAMAGFVGHVCSCGIGRSRASPGAQLRASRRLSAGRFLRFLCGVNPVLTDGRLVHIPSTIARPLTESVESWLDWLADWRGLSTQSIAMYRREIVSWHEQLGEDASRYSAALIREVADRALAGRSPTGQNRFLTVIRGYLRFRAKRGECPGTLVGAIISRKSYCLGTVPRTLPFETLRDVIAGCDPQTPVGLRQRAVLTLLLESGMRAGEAAGLRLSDLDWDRAQVRIRGKGGRASAKPLTQGMGEALLDWLERGRPATDSDTVFVRLRRPFTGLTGSAVSLLVGVALARAGFKRMGRAHLFRHSFARALLKNGAGLHEIGGALGHKSLVTTTIYTKVDENALMTVARPWSGEAQ